MSLSKKTIRKVGCFKAVWLVIFGPVFLEEVPPTPGGFCQKRALLAMQVFLPRESAKKYPGGSSKKLPGGFCRKRAPVFLGGASPSLRRRAVVEQLH